MLWKFPLPLTKKITDTIVCLSPKPQEIFFDNFDGGFTREMPQHLFDSAPYPGLSSVDPYANANALFERSNTQNFLSSDGIYQCKYGFSPTPDEAGSNEPWPCLSRVGCPFLIIFGRLCGDYSTAFALARTCGKAVGLKSCRKVFTSSYRSSPENGISRAIRSMAQRRLSRNGRRNLVGQ